MDDEVIDLDEIDDEVVPPFRLSWKLLLADFLNNVGGTMEQLAAFPHDVALRLEGDRKWRERTKEDYAAGRRDIDRLIQEVEGG